MSVTHVMQRYQSILEEEVPQIARETGAVKRVRRDGIDASTLVQSAIVGVHFTHRLCLSAKAFRPTPSVGSRATVAGDATG